MMNKKVYLVFIFGLLILLPLILNSVTSLIAPSVPEYSSSIVNASTKIAQASSNFLGGTSGSGTNLTSQWADTGKQLKDSLLKVPFIKAADLFFQAINFFFVFLFGTNYSLSLAFLLTVGLWIFFFFSFKNMFKMVSLFSNWVNLLIAFGLTIVLAQVGLFSMIITAVIQLFFGEQTWWMKVIIGVLIVLGLVLIFGLLKRFGKKAAENKKKRKDEENRIKLDTGAKAGEELSKAVGGRK